MGFTVADMLIIATEKYDMQLVAGKNGWANSISWLLMVEDTTITKSFLGKELVVTTGLGFNTEEKLIELIDILTAHHGAGLVVNVGNYIQEIPERVLQHADRNDLPLMVVPWEISMVDMIKDLTVRIFLQTLTDEQISKGFRKAIEHPQDQENYRDELSQAFDVDGRFQVVVITAKGLDSMDSMDRKRIAYRLQIYLENISHTAHFFYYDGCFLLILNAVNDEQRDEIIDGFLKRAKLRMPDAEIFVGIGSAVMDIANVHISYKRGVYAANYALKRALPIMHFDEIGVERLLYSVRDQKILGEMGEEVLKPLLEYDREHNSDLVETLRLYLKHNGSYAKIAEELYIHKNTILYRMGKIKELLDTTLEDGEERLKLFLAITIVNDIGGRG